MRHFVIALFLFAGLSSAACATSIDIGPEIGTPIPQPFIVQDNTNKERSLNDLSGSSGTVLVFVRSASWCPYCMAQLKDIQKVAEPLHKRGYALVTVSYDEPEILTKFIEKYGVTYTMTSDVGSKMIDAFGIRDPQYKKGSIAYGVPKPSIFILDKLGVVRAKLAEEGFKVRPPSEAIVASIDALQHP